METIWGEEEVVDLYGQKTVSAVSCPVIKEQRKSTPGLFELNSQVRKLIIFIATEEHTQIESPGGCSIGETSGTV
jgi:hypothetical protein